MENQKTQTMETEINTEVAIRHIPVSVREVNEEKRTVDFVISTDAIDRHTTVLSADGWVTDAYMRNPIFGYQHEVYGSMFNKSDPDDVIGKGIKTWQEKGETMLRVEFEPKEINEKAEKLFRKVLFGSLGSVSVGFLPLPGEHGETKITKLKSGKEIEVFYYGKRELLEVSLVNIPSNREAQKRAYEAEVMRDMLMLYKNGDKLEGDRPDEHTVRLIDPKEFNDDTFRTTKNKRAVLPGAGLTSVPDTATVIWGKQKGSDAPEDQPLAQSLRFPTEDWTEKEARDWLKENKVKFLLFEPVIKKVLSLQKKRLELESIS